VLRAARASTKGHVIAIVQAASLHAPFASLFNEFAACFNDADTVIVADVYAAGEAPIAGADRDHLIARSRPMRTAGAGPAIARRSRRHDPRTGQARRLRRFLRAPATSPNGAYALPANSRRGGINKPLW